MQEKVYKKRIKDIDELRARDVSWQLGTKWISALLMQQSDSGAHVFVHALKSKADTLNTQWVSNEFWRTQQHWLGLLNICAKFYHFMSVYSKAVQ